MQKKEREVYVYVTTDYKPDNCWRVTEKRLKQNRRDNEEPLFHRITDQQFKDIQDGKYEEEEIEEMDLTEELPEDLYSKKKKPTRQRKLATGKSALEK